MTEMTLIPVVPGNISGHAAQLVDARQLHEFLGVGRDFSNWIKGRIQEYEFVEKQDYLLAKSGEKHQLDSPNPANQEWGGDRRSIDYFLTLDMAKELAMVERTPRGRQARRYFIECERQLRQLHQSLPASMTAVTARLTRDERQAINRQAWADVAGDAQAAFHARREALIQARAEAKSTGPVQLPRGFRPTWAR
jgi:phage anti-repressor protein